MVLFYYTIQNISFFNTVFFGFCRRSQEETRVFVFSFQFFYFVTQHVVLTILSTLLTKIVHALFVVNFFSKYFTNSA